jgi:hypothetical protein
MKAPIILFVYNRPSHTLRTINALKQNGLAAESDLFIFSDGERSSKDRDNVEQVREVSKSIQGFKSVNIRFSPVNKGLANSIIDGVTEVVNLHGSAIVMEDDLVTSPYFLSYMNQALDLYRNDEEVVCINGYFYPIGRDLPQSFFLRGADCQGWATWKRGWKVFNPDGKYLLNELKRRGQVRAFDYNGSYSFTRMLNHQQKGLVDSWAIRWYASAFLENKLTLYPGQSLLKNIGFDNSGTNSSDWDKKRYDTSIQMNDIQLNKIPIGEDADIRRLLGNYFKTTQKPLFLKVKDKLRSLLKRFR